MKNKDTFKKHHFWILFGIVPLFVLIAVLVMGSSVGGRIEGREKEINAKETAIKAKSNPKPKALIKKMEEVVDYINSKQEGLWKGSYNPQKSLYTWPNSPLLKQIERRGLKFGDKVPNDRDEYEEFRKKEVYLARYNKMAESVAPSAFANGWESVLRHVNTWTDVRLTSEQIWLLLEDIWVQESLLEAVSSVNAQMAEFTRVKFERDGVVIDDPASDKKDGKGPSDKLRRKFRSRIWDIELEVVDEGPKKILKGTLINTTDKLQMFGIGNTMVLRVWLQPGDRKTVQPFDFKIGGEFLPGAGAKRFIKDKDGKNVEVDANVLNVPRTDDHIIPPGMPVGEIVAVEQVFDSRTVPIRRIENMALGFPDSRNAALPLFTPNFPSFVAEAAAAAQPADAGGQGPGGGSGSAAGQPGGGSAMGPGRFGPAMPGGTGANNNSSTKKFSGGGTVAEVIDGNKKRYIDKPTDQVRRLPVGIVVIVDQVFLQDVLLALANSPIRFQITQVTWNRFRDSLKSDSDSGSVGIPNQASGGGGIQQSGRGKLGSDFGGSMGGPPGGLRPPSGPGPGPGILPGGPTGPGSAMGAYGASSSSTVSESQLTSGLIELKVYGIVSLYTSPEAPAVDPNAAKKDKELKEGEPQKDSEPKKDKESKKGKEPQEPKKDKEPQEPKKDKEPMPTTTDPKTTKM